MSSNSREAAAARAAALLAEATLEEKAGLLFHPATYIGRERDLELVRKRGISHLNIVDGSDPAEIARWHNALQEAAEGTRLKIPVTLSSDPRHHVRSSPVAGESIATLSRWPETTGIAASGDEEVARLCGDTVRQELTALGIRVLLGPMADIFSDPRWSRGYGTFGEDPDTVRRFTVAFIEGLRGGTQLGSESVAAMVKHFPGAGPQRDGRDAHDSRFREQVYPGGAQALHLAPFEAAIAAGVTQMMTYYGMPIGTEWEEVGFAFNRPVVHDLLRTKLGFRGIICTDWNVIDGAPREGVTFGPNAWGLEHLTPEQRMARALNVGVDQFGGDDCVDLAINLVRTGIIPEARIDKSALRLLTEKFQLGLFSQRRANPKTAAARVGTPELRARGEATQRNSLTLLQHNTTELSLPLTQGVRIYCEGISAASLVGFAAEATEPESADLIVVRLNAPYEVGDGRFDEWFHGGSLDFSQAVVDHVRDLSHIAPVIVSVFLERPAILTPLLPHASVLIGDFGASDENLLKLLFGEAPFTGHLPFDLPRSMAAVERSKEDLPFDTEDPLFRHGFRIQSTG
jgi:beta-glucosidase